jgi:hypothetical protein
MYYRLTKVTHHEGDQKKMIAHLDSMKHLIGAIDGLHHVRLVAISPTEMMAISKYDNAEQVAKAQEQFTEIMIGMKPFFAAPPEVMHGDVFWDFSQE